ncbi:MAG: ThuA domain-containing protein, partial [Planctomycetes bacterium]|nr:ThuA domain-containing protein [Planctomycetota bacterium]
MFKQASFLTFFLSISISLCSAKLPPLEHTQEWLSRVENLAPEKADFKPQQPRKVLVFSLMTGFKHWVTPFMKDIVKTLGDKSGAFETTFSDNIAMFEKDKLQMFDTVILNNTCSKSPKRHLFFDALGDMKKAKELENNLISYIENGGGLVGLHGAIAVLSGSDEFGKVIGGSFHFHPKQQDVTCKLVTPSHKLLKSFKGSPLIHHDEPYMFKGSYDQFNFQPLLELDADKLDWGH